MALQTMPIDTTRLEFRYHGATAYHAFNRDTEKRDDEQARDDDTGLPVYSVRCQVLFRDVRQSGLITVRVPLKTPPTDDVDFEAPVVFTGATSKSWNMDGRDGQTWTAESMTFTNPTRPTTPPSPSAPGKKDGE